MEYYVEIKKVGNRTYNSTFNQKLAELALECIARKRTICMTCIVGTQRERVV